MNAAAKIDEIIDSLNEMLKALTIGQHLQACTILTGVTQKLLSVQSDIKHEDETVDMLKSELRKRGVEVAEIGGVNE